MTPPPATPSTAQNNTSSDPVDSRPGGVKALMAILLLACLAFQLNASMLSSALTVMSQELHTTEAAVGLSQTAFFTGGALCALFLPRMSDIVGRRRILFIMMLVMTLGAVGAALAPTITLLIGFRALQGIAGPTIPLVLLILHSQVKNPVRLGTLMGVIAAVNGGIAGIDVLLSGWMVTHFSFRSIFWLIAVVGAIAAFTVLRFAPESQPNSGAKMDWVGSALLVVSVFALTMSVTEISQGNLGRFAALIVLGVGAFVLFWKWENSQEEPLVATKYLKRRSTWALLLTTVLTMSGVFAAVNAVAVSLAQNPTAGFGMNPDTASLLLLTPYALIGWLVGPFAGRYAPQWGYERLLRIGIALSALFLVIAALGVHSKFVLVAIVWGLGVTYAGIINIMLNGLGLINSPSDNEGFLPGMNSSMFNLGAGISFAILPAIMVAGSPAGSSDVLGYVQAYYVGSAFLAASFIVSLLIPKRA